MKVRKYIIDVLVVIPLLLTWTMFILFVDRMNTIGFIAFLGWILFSIICIYMRNKLVKIETDNMTEKIKIFNDFTETLSMVDTTLQSTLGYHGELDDGISLYSRMLGNGNSVPVTNIVTSFVGSLKGSESIFLIKANHVNRKWSVYMCGEPIHIDVVRWLLTRLYTKCDDICRNGTSIIWSSKDICN